MATWVEVLRVDELEESRAPQYSSTSVTSPYTATKVTTMPWTIAAFIGTVNWVTGTWTARM